MATIKHIPSNGNNAHMESTNHYIADGHGNEQMVRTNRYLDDGHGLATELRGYGCPADPDLATTVMEDARVKYELNLAGKKTRGTNDTKKPVSHEHLVVSWAPGEEIAPSERHAMVAELISKTKLRKHPVLAADHNNETDHYHMHLSVGVYSLDGKSKLCLNNRLLYELRRQMDYICVERGYSICERPELFADEEYHEWFKKIKKEGKVTIHPPHFYDKYLGPSEKDKFAYHTGYAHREEHIKEDPPLTDENRGSHFYCIPHLFNPFVEHTDVKQPLYIYALDKQEQRRAPMHLAFDLERQWCYQCWNYLQDLDVPGKVQLEQRLSSTMKSAEESRNLLEKLDIGSSVDLQRHLKGIGRDLNKCREYIKELDESLSGETFLEQKQKLSARKTQAEERERALSLEYRKLVKVKKMYQELLDPEEWSGYTTALFRRATSRLTEEERLNETIRWHYRDMAQLFGADPDRVDDMILQFHEDPHAILSTWVEVRGSMSIKLARTAEGVYTIYECIDDLFARRAESKQASWEFYRDLENDPWLLLIFFPLVIAVSVADIVSTVSLEREIAASRQLAEEIRWHNRNAQEQLTRAQTKCAMLIAYGDSSAAAMALEELNQVCDYIMDRATMLEMREMQLPMPRSAEPSDLVYMDAEERALNTLTFSSSVKHYRQEIERVKREMRDLLEQRSLDNLPVIVAPGPGLWDEKSPKETKKPSLDAMVKSANDRSSQQEIEQKNHQQKEKER